MSFFWILVYDIIDHHHYPYCCHTRWQYHYCVLFNNADGWKIPVRYRIIPIYPSVWFNAVFAVEFYHFVVFYLPVNYNNSTLDKRHETMRQ